MSFGALVIDIFGPFNKGRRRARRAIAIMDDKLQSRLLSSFRNFRQRFGDRTQQPASLCTISRHNPPGEIIGCGVAHIFNDEC